MAEEVLQALIGHVAGEELTIFFSSHEIAEVDQIADRVAIIHRGRTVIDGALDDLRERYRRVQLAFERARRPSSSARPAWSACSATDGC
jgi:ABC-2 type transport system ATP-binding protein